MDTLTLIPGTATLADLERIWREGAAVRLDPAARSGVEAAARMVTEAASGEEAVYGVNTGFGKLASVKIAAADTAELQRNLVLSHCCGVGAPLDVATTRLMMALKLLSLGRGASGVRWDVIDLIEAMLATGVTPVVPSQGSVGASGDLAPLAHMAAAMIGEGEALHGGDRMPAGEALRASGLAPVALGAKEGLALINGTQFSTACALTGLWRAWRAATASTITAALSTDAIMGSTAPLLPRIHALRGHAGQIDVAREMREIMEGSEIRESHRTGDPRVQDPYCIRCVPQVVGAAVDLLRMAARTLRIEANAVTDNPLVLMEDGRIVSGGNFHAEPVAFAADQIALAVAEIGAIAQRRVALMVDPTLNHDLPPFLTPEPGLNSGFMIAEVTTAALMSENKHLANPCSTDSTPTSANQEDHVSMAAHGARRLGRMCDNLEVILGVELMCAAQGIEFRAPLQTSPRPRRGGRAPALRRACARPGPLHGAGDRARDRPDPQRRRLPGGQCHPDTRGDLMQPVEVREGTLPIVLGLPHAGTWLPDEVAERLNETGRALADTDWHVDRLYEGLLPGASTVRATFHRYVIDANRDPTGKSLYPDRNTTGLCPLTDFDGTPIYEGGCEPGEDDIEQRRDAYHAHYHGALAGELERVRQERGMVILYDCHSIRSRIPYLFEGTLPDLNIGTDGGRTCDPRVEAAMVEACAASDYSHVLNGRFRGGWTTRYYGRPEDGVHAIQMEIAQSAYMDETPPWEWRDDRAERLRGTLRTILDRLADLAQKLGGTA